MTEKLGIPVWGSYVIFGLATLFSGLALGLVSNFAALCHYETEMMFITNAHIPSGLTVNPVLSVAVTGVHCRFRFPLKKILFSRLLPE